MSSPTDLCSLTSLSLFLLFLCPLANSTSIWIAGYLCLIFFSSLVSLIVRKADERGLLTLPQWVLYPMGLWQQEERHLLCGHLGLPAGWHSSLRTHSYVDWQVRISRAFKFYNWKKKSCFDLHFYFRVREAKHRHRSARRHVCLGGLEREPIPQNTGSVKLVIFKWWK